MRWRTRHDAMIEHETGALVVQYVGQTAETSAGVATAQAVAGIRSKTPIMHVIGHPAMPARDIRSDLHAQPNLCIPLAGRIEMQYPLPHALDPAADRYRLDTKERGGVCDRPLL